MSKKGTEGRVCFQRLITYIAVFAFQPVAYLPQICNTPPNLFTTIFKNLKETWASYFQQFIISPREELKPDNIESMKALHTYGNMQLTFLKKLGNMTNN